MCGSAHRFSPSQPRTRGVTLRDYRGRVAGRNQVTRPHPRLTTRGGRKQGSCSAGLRQCRLCATRKVTVEGREGKLGTPGKPVFIDVDWADILAARLAVAIGPGTVGLGKA